MLLVLYAYKPVVCLLLRYVENCDLILYNSNMMQYRYVEFYVNISNGGQHFQFSVPPDYGYEVKPGDWPTNTWIKVQIEYSIVQVLRTNCFVV